MRLLSYPTEARIADAFRAMAGGDIPGADWSYFDILENCDKKRLSNVRIIGALMYIANKEPHEVTFEEVRQALRLVRHLTVDFEISPRLTDTEARTL